VSTFYVVVQDNILLSIYANLISIELTLKDYHTTEGLDFTTKPFGRNGHDIIPYLLNNGFVHSDILTQMVNKLTSLKCTIPGGSEGNVYTDNYPAIRYIRHSSDWTDGVTDEQLTELFELIKEVIIQMAAKNQGLKII
jgi:hypothetical protein